MTKHIYYILKRHNIRLNSFSVNSNKNNKESKEELNFFTEIQIKITISYDSLLISNELYLMIFDLTPIKND